MARLWSCGFELDSNADGIEFDIGDPSIILNTSIPRSGTYAAEFVNGGTIEFRFSAAPGIAGIVYYRVYLYVITAPNTNHSFNPLEMYASSGDPMFFVELNSNKTLTVVDGFNGGIKTTSSALNLNQWYRIELKVDNTTKSATTFDCRVDGVSFGTGTADFSGIVNNQSYFDINNNGSFGLTCDCLIDDIGINDTTTSFQNSWPGDEKLIPLRPNAAGDSNTFATKTGGTAGSSNNYTRVNEITPDDATTFNGSNTLNQEDLFNMDNSGIGATDTINVVHVGARFRNNTVDATTAIKLEIEKTANGTISQSATIVPNNAAWFTNAVSQPRNYQLITYQDPDNINWTQATLDSMQAGYKITTGGTNRIDVSTLWVLVGYTPAAAPVVTNPIGYAQGNAPQPYIRQDIINY